MILYVFDSAGRRVGMVEQYHSLQWNRQYFEAGNFVLHCTTQYGEMLQPDSILWPNGEQEAGIIESVDFQQSQDGAEMLVVGGKMLTGLLGGRGLAGMHAYSGSYEGLMYALVDRCAVHAAPEQIIPRLQLAALQGYTPQVESYSGGNKQLQLVIEDLSKACGLGHRIVFHPDDASMTFEVYAGLDRTAGQRVHSPAIFAEEYENLMSAQYHYSKLKSANVAIVLGDGEGDARVMRTVGSATGLARREIIVDAKSVKRKIDKETTLTDEQYHAALDQFGWEKLAQALPIESVDAQILPAANLVYRKDYDLGDMVTVRFARWNKQADVRITEVQEVYEQAGRTVYAILGDDAWLPIERLERQLM